MARESYSFQLGEFACTAVKDGTHAYAHPVALLFPTAPRESLEPVLQGHNLQPESWEEFLSPYTCLLVKTREHTVLIDTGAGDNFGPETGRLLQNLQAEGVLPEDIDTVILTHAHPDHIGGNTAEGGQPAFPNARYVIWKDEWDFWTGGRAGAELPGLGLGKEFEEVVMGIAQKNLPPIKNQLEPMEKEGDIVPGIRAVATCCHTPGHLVPVISSGNQRLYYISDVFIHPIHVERPEWPMAVDLAPEQVVSTRRWILDKAAQEKALVHAFHFPFPGLGRVVKQGEGYRWQPVD